MATPFSEISHLTRTKQAAALRNTVSRNVVQPT